MGHSKCESKLNLTIIMYLVLLSFIKSSASLTNCVTSIMGPDMSDKETMHNISYLKLRSVDLNLLPVFVAVMHEQSYTRAGHALGLSQPAVSNAVARLKVMFNNDLFIRKGRGIVPTKFACQLYLPVYNALTAIQKALSATR